MKKGIVLAICTSPRAGCPKYTQPSAEIAEYGLNGDFHCKPMRRSFAIPGLQKPNTDRHVTVVGMESLEFANQTLGLNLKAGDLAENILTAGLGDLSELKPDDRLGIGSRVILRVCEQNKPCKNLLVYHKQLPKVLQGKRGVLCAVEKGAGEVITLGDPVVVVSH